MMWHLGFVIRCTCASSCGSSTTSYGIGGNSYRAVALLQLVVPHVYRAALAPSGAAILLDAATRGRWRRVPG